MFFTVPPFLPKIPADPQAHHKKGQRYCYGREDPPLRIHMKMSTRALEEVHAKNGRDECPWKEYHCQNGNRLHGLAVSPGLICYVFRLLGDSFVNLAVFLSGKADKLAS
jgi:hypothetical protein